MFMGKRRQAPTFLLELPLVVTQGQAKHLRAHLEAGRQFYNAVLSEGQRRMRQMRADPAWKAARAIPRSRKPERAAAFSRLREQYGFSEYALHQTATALRASWIAEHLDAVLAQTLATRAYHALNRVCVGKARRVRFKSRGRGLSSIENKRNDTGLRFVLQSPEEGNQGFVLWKGDALGALFDWNDPVVKHGLAQRIKYARLIKRRASSQRAAGADSKGNRYSVQLALEGVPYHKPKHLVGSDTIGLDLGPSSVAVVPHEGEASLTRRSSVACSARWTDSGERATRSTTTSKAASRSAARRRWSGKAARATRKPGSAKPPENASSPPIGRACMDVTCMRSWQWGTPSSSKRFLTGRGRNSMGGA
jgi:hypothetical protein